MEVVPRFDMNVTFLLAFLLLVSTTFASSPNQNGGAGHESTYTYKVGSGTGPEHWSELDPNWKICGTGKLQSPIDVVDQGVELLPAMGKLKRYYKPVPAVLKHRGHDITVEWQGDAGKLVVNGTDYKLLRCHWHTPADHTLNGTRPDLELHILHQNSAGEFAVIGILYKVGCSDPFIEKILPHVKKTENGGVAELGILSPGEIKFGSRSYYRYVGSLTTPPCTEGIIWNILKKVRTASKEQINALSDALQEGYKTNARPTQARNGRPVYMYTPQA